MIKLITKGTIEEDMFSLGQTKLALDDAVAGNSPAEEDDTKVEQEMKVGLLHVLRQKFDDEGQGEEKGMDVDQ